MGARAIVGELHRRSTLDGCAGAVASVFRRHSTPNGREGVTTGELCGCSVLEGRAGAAAAELHRRTAPYGHELVERQRIFDDASPAVAVHTRPTAWLGGGRCI